MAGSTALQTKLWDQSESSKFQIVGLIIGSPAPLSAFGETENGDQCVITSLHAADLLITNASLWRGILAYNVVLNVELSIDAVASQN